MSDQIASPLRRTVLVVVVTLCLAAGASLGATPWGKDYFPNLLLTDQDGKQVRFFDDLIEGKIVVINFIYTSCPDTCPLETAQLVKVQDILGDRLGKDLFFYSITLDPKRDTPAVLKEYKEKFRAKWTFLTGSEDDIWTLQRKLGLFLEEIRDGLNNHNVNMIIGNQATGRWMKRSPHENPYVLADQIGNWLDGWKRPPELDSYENAPRLRDLSRGEQLFRTRCTSCHTVTGREPERALGPDLLGVTFRRDTAWLLNWLREPDQMIADRDPIALALYEKYNKLAMPNLRLNEAEAVDLIKFLEGETRRIAGDGQVIPREQPPAEGPKPPVTQAAAEAGPFETVVAIEDGWIREAHPAAKVNVGYLTLVNESTQSVTLREVRSESFGRVAIQEMAKIDGVMKRRSLSDLEIPAGAQVALKPGGRHLLLKERKESLHAGHEIEMTLVFESGLRQKIGVKVGNRE